MAHIKVKELREYLAYMDRTELEQEIVELFKLYPNIKDYFTTRVAPGSEVELLVKYKKAVEKEFLSDKGAGLARLSVLNKTVSEFKKASVSPKAVVELLLFYVDEAMEYVNALGIWDQSLYSNIYRVFEDCLKHIGSNKLITPVLQARLMKVVEMADDVSSDFGCEMINLLYMYVDMPDDEEESDYEGATP